MKYNIAMLLPLVAIVFSCVREEVPEVVTPVTQPITAKAVINNGPSASNVESKTTYDIDEVNHRAVFYWNGSESFVRAIRHNSGSKPYALDVFTSSGSKTTERDFTCDSPLTDDAEYEDTKIAFYPYYNPDPNGANVSFETGRSDSHFYYSIGNELAFNSSAPLDGIVPMVGLYDSENNKYDFKPLTGVLAIRMTGIPASATKLTISSASYKMAGKTIKITDKTDLSDLQTTIKTYTYDKGLSQNLLDDSLSQKSKSFTFSSLDPDEEYIFYFPMPISANYNSGTTTLDDLTVTLYDGSESIYQMSTTKKLTITRGEITRLPLITVTTAKVSVYNSSNDPWLKIYHSKSIGRICVNVSQNSTNNPANYPEGLHFKDAYPVNYQLKSWSSGSLFSTTGTYYLHYLILNTAVNAYTLEGLSDARIISYGTIPFYYLDDTDKAAVVSQYLRDPATGTTTSISTEMVSSITLSVSNEPTKGNIMISEFLGYNYQVENSVMPHTGFTSGTPLYGTYSSGAASFDVVSTPFCTASDGKKYMVSTVTSANTAIDFVFDKAGEGYDLVYKNTVGDTQKWLGMVYDDKWGTGSKYIMYYTTQDYKYGANKTAGMVDLTGKISVSSTGANNNYDGDNLGASALIDASTSHWHSDYVTTPTADPTYGIYVQIDLGGSKTLQNFTLKFLTRNSSAQLPRKYIIGGSNDGSTWTALTEETAISVGLSQWVVVPITAGAAYRYIRLGLTESVAGNLKTEPSTSKYVALAEVQIWE